MQKPMNCNVFVKTGGFTTLGDLRITGWFYAEESFCIRGTLEAAEEILLHPKYEYTIMQSQALLTFGKITVIGYGDFDFPGEIFALEGSHVK